MNSVEKKNSWNADVASFANILFSKNSFIIKIEGGNQFDRENFALNVMFLRIFFTFSIKHDWSKVETERNFVIHSHKIVCFVYTPAIKTRFSSVRNVNVWFLFSLLFSIFQSSSCCCCRNNWVRTNPSQSMKWCCRPPLKHFLWWLLVGGGA